MREIRFRALIGPLFLVAAAPLMPKERARPRERLPSEGLRLRRGG